MSPEDARRWRFIDRMLRLYGGLENVFLDRPPELPEGVIAGWISEED